MGKASTKKKERRVQQTVSERRTKSSSGIWFGAIIVAVLVLGGVLAFLAISGKDASDETDEIVPPPGTETFSDLSRNHVDSPTFSDPVPTGGDHLSIWQNCGVYEQPQETGNLVHSMEHGAVWISYDPALPAADRQKLESLAGVDSFVVIAPNDELSNGEIYAAAWGYRLKADSADDDRLSEFTSMFARGPQTPEPGAGCTGGVGSPG